MLPVHFVARRHLHYGGCTASELISYVTASSGSGKPLGGGVAGSSSSSGGSGGSPSSQFPRPEPCARRPWQLTGVGSSSPWQMPRIIFGLDDHGTSASDRASMLHAAVTVKGANALVFNGDEVLGRGGVSTHPLRPFERHWEAFALQRLFSRTGGGLRRGEVMVGASLHVAGCGSHPGGLKGRLLDLLAALHLQRLDLLLLHLPRDAQGAAGGWSLREGTAAGGASSPAASGVALLRQAECVVGEGLTQFYGVGCGAWSMGGEESGAGAGRGGQHLPSLFAALEGVRGVAAKVRKERLEAGGGGGGRAAALGNTMALPLGELDGIGGGSGSGGSSFLDSVEEGGLESSGDSHLGMGSSGGSSSSSSRGVSVGGGGSGYDTSAALAGDAVLLAPSPTSHSCVAIATTGNLLTLDAVFPSGGLPSEGSPLGSSSSVLAAARARGLATLALHPLDCTPSQAAVDASGDAWRAAGRYAWGGSNGSSSGGGNSSGSSSTGSGENDPPPREPTPFRCINTPLSLEEAHPARAAPLLSDTLNFAVHLETLWDSEVGRAALEEEGRERARSAQAGGSGVSGGKWGMTLEIGRGATAPIGTPGAPTSNAAAAGGADGSSSSSTLGVASLTRTDTSWARILAGSVMRIDSLMHWQWVKRARIIPAVSATVMAALPLGASREWATAYRLVMGDLTGRFDTLQEQEHSGKASLVEAALKRGFFQASGISESSSSTTAAAALALNDLPTLTLKVLLSPAVGFDTVVSESPGAYRAIPLGSAAHAAAAQGGLEAGWEVEVEGAASHPPSPSSSSSTAAAAAAATGTALPALHRAALGTRELTPGALPGGLGDAGRGGLEALQKLKRGGKLHGELEAIMCGPPLEFPPDPLAAVVGGKATA